MARISALDPRLAPLLADYLVPWFLELGSVAALSALLNDASAVAGGPAVHPNRLHTLLSDSAARSLNERSVHAIEVAAGIAARTRPPNANAAFGSRSASEIERQWRITPAQHREPHHVAAALSVPPAVVRWVVARGGAPEQSRVVTAATETVSVPPSTSAAPDWSYQSVAMERALAALNRGPGRRVGLFVPTGGGKTAIALSTALRFLAQAENQRHRALWIVHRRPLHVQAERALQQVLNRGVPGLSREQALAAAARIDFRMLAEAAEALTAELPVVLTIVDEAHHAAADSYAPILEARGVSVLFLTATPNRTDGRPIGVDDVAYTVSFRELTERGVLLRPQFEDLPVADFDWAEDSLRDLVDYLIDRSADDYTKTLVIAPRIDRVVELHAMLLDRLAAEGEHPLHPEDVGYVHSTGNSRGWDTRAFLADFHARPRGILVSAQMLLEGYDDPSVNAVVLTYPSQSVIVLMQAVGRCVRYAPGKNHAFVLQARNDRLAYHFDQRWLYQEIDAALRPDLRDFEYGTLAELQGLVEDVLESHQVLEDDRAAVAASMAEIVPGETCRLLLSGIPYSGPTERFETDARWGAILETSVNSAQVRGIFNAFSAVGAPTADPLPFLDRVGANYGMTRGGDPEGFRRYAELLTSMHRARVELDGAPQHPLRDRGRPHTRHGPTTWLRYVTFEYRPRVPTALDAFLDDCHNRDEVLRAFLSAPASAAVAIKVSLPLEGYEAHLLDQPSADHFRERIESYTQALRAVDPGEQYGRLAALNATAGPSPLPARVGARLDEFLPARDVHPQVLALGGAPNQPMSTMENLR